METPGNLRKDAFHDLDQAEQIVQQAVRESRGMSRAEKELVSSLRATAEPMLARARVIEDQLTRTGVE